MRSLGAGLKDVRRPNKRLLLSDAVANAPPRISESVLLSDLRRERFKDFVMTECFADQGDGSCRGEAGRIVLAECEEVTGLPM